MLLYFDFGDHLWMLACAMPTLLALLSLLEVSNLHVLGRRLLLCQFSRRRGLLCMKWGLSLIFLPLFLATMVV